MADEGEVVLLRIPVRDPGRAGRFYGALFDWAVGGSAGVDPGVSVDFRTRGGLRGVFAVGEPSTAGPEVYVGVVDVAASVRRAVTLGGAALVRPGGAGARRAVVLDTEGNRVGLWEIGRGEGIPDVRLVTGLPTGPIR